MSMMKTLAKVAVGVAVAKGVSGMMKGGSSAGGANAGLGGLLGGLAGGASGGASGLESMLGAVLGGGAGGTANAASGAGLGGLLENLGGMAAGSRASAGGGLDSLLSSLGGASGGAGGLLGGLATAAAGGAAGGGLAGMLGSMMGGGAQAAAPSSNAGFGNMLNQAIARQDEPEETPSPEQEAMAALMLAAMIQAMKSDGQIDEAEQARLMDRLGDVDAEEMAFVKDQMAAPVDVDRIANATPQGLEGQVYAMSVMGIDLDHKAEAEYLHALGQALGLQPAQLNEIHAQLGVVPLYS